MPIGLQTWDADGVMRLDTTTTTSHARGLLVVLPMTASKLVLPKLPAGKRYFVYADTTGNTQLLVSFSEHSATETALNYQTYKNAGEVSSGQARIVYGVVNAT